MAGVKSIELINVEQNIIDILKECRIDTVLSLPCNRIKNLLPLITNNFKEISLTREEDGIGLATGLYLSGKKPALLIQSSGIGNSLSAIASLHMTYEIPLPILTSWRGVYKEGAVVSHVYFGKCLPDILNGFKISYCIIKIPFDIHKMKNAIVNSFESQKPYIVLFLPSIWENSNIVPIHANNDSIQEKEFAFKAVSFVPSAKYTRYEMIKAIIPYINGKIVISNIGFTSKELYSLFDQPSNFYMLGSMGLATSIGTGIAIGKREREIIVLDGDGSLLMNPNALSSLAQEYPNNLTVIAFDNHSYGSTGGQRTFSSNIDLKLLAQAYGIENTSTAITPDDLLKTLETKQKGPRFIHTLIMSKNIDVPEVPLSPVEIKKRFMQAI